MFDYWSVVSDLGPNGTVTQVFSKPVVILITRSNWEFKLYKDTDKF